MSAWASLELARTLWADAPLDDALLTAYLDTAQEVCEAYAPPLPDATIPDRYSVAVVMQAQETWNAVQRENTDVIGFADEGYAIRVRPLSTTVKALLRPHSPIPGVG